MKYIKKYWQIIFPIIIMIIIWNFSAQNGEESDGISIALAAKLGLTNGTIRKIAHFLIYLLLGASLTNFFRSLKPKKYPNLKAVLLPLAIAIIFSIIDEYHQSLVPGRNGTSVDVVIDSLGTVAGICIFVSIFCFIKCRKIAKR